MKLLALATLALLGLGAKQDASYDLIWHPHSGDSIGYKLKLDIDSTPEKFTFLSNLKTKVLKIKPNGDYDVETRISDVHVKHGTHDDASTDEEKPTVDTYNSRGEKIATSEDVDPAEDASPGQNAIDAITDEITPKMPVKVGDTWTATIQPSTTLKREAGKVTYKLVGVEKQGAYQALKIIFNYKETEKDSPMTADGYIMYNQGDFSLVRVEIAIKGAQFNKDPDFPKGDATMSLIRD